MQALPTTMRIEYFGEVSIYIGIGIQVITSMILGGIVGFDREKKMKVAGIKTNILICLGATMYTSMSILNVMAFGGPIDPNRVGAQIVSGIGFLGAGAIIQGRGNVVGLTTATMIWVVASIGYTIGIGYPLTAAIFSFSVLLMLKIVSPLYKLLENESEFNYYHLEILSTGSVKRIVSSVINLENAHVEDMTQVEHDKRKNKKILNIFLLTHPRTIDRILSEINSSVTVDKVNYRKIEREANGDMELIKSDEEDDKKGNDEVI
jgi:putative Mg2+ transporter-C (MgtC) family protein